MKRLGRYTILEELGRGAMGMVYRALDPEIDRVVAIKVISVRGLSPTEQEAFRERFFREAQAAGRLSHPCIVTVYDVGKHKATNTPFIVMEYVEGKTLGALSRGERPLREASLGVVRQVAEALDYAHSRQIVHRDIKPANIIVTPEGRAKITDFGVAKLQTVEFTQPGQLLGTPAYMSPEQFRGGTVDGRSDLFSLGVVLYWLLTGNKPFVGDTTTAISFNVVYQDPTPPTRFNPALSPDYDYVLLRALAKAPEQRYQRGREFAEDLADLKNGLSPRSRTAPLTAAEQNPTLVAQPGGAAPGSSDYGETEAIATALLAGQTGVTPAARLPAGRKPGRLLPATLVTLLLIIFGFAGWWRWGGISLWNQEGSEPDAAQNAAPAMPASASARLPAGETKAEPRPSPGTPTGAVRAHQPDAGSWSQPAPMATLQLRGDHNFDHAILYVYADRELRGQVRLGETSLEQYGVSVGLGMISASVPLAAGRRTIGVYVHAPQEDFNQLEYIEGNFDPGRTRTLQISLSEVGKWVGIGKLTRRLTLRWLD